MVCFVAVAETRVEFTDVSKRFGGRTVFSGLSGELRPGRVTVITGHNGSGKSTLLNILAGVLRPSSGRVRYRDGGDDGDLPRNHWFARLGVAAPDMAVYEELSALENLAFFARLRRLDIDHGEIESVLLRLGLDRRDQRRRVGTYSSGMRQRVKLAQAVVHRPGVLLLDEPSSNLDAAGHDVVAGLVASFREHAAVAVATNDPREMAWADDRVELAR